jgi:hypothetical protein
MRVLSGPAQIAYRIDQLQRRGAQGALQAFPPDQDVDAGIIDDEGARRIRGSAAQRLRRP